MPQLFPATFNAVSAILAIGLASLMIYIYNRFSYWSRRGISGPNHYFPLLNWYGFTQKPVADTYIENFKKYGKIWGRYDGLHPILVISEKNLAQKILNDTITFPDRFELAAKRDIEDSLLPFVAGQRWKTLHSALTPCFTTGKMKILFQPMKQCADKAMDEIEKSANDNGKPFQIEFKRLFDRYTLDVAAKCFFAKDLNPYEDGEFVLNANKFAYILFWRMISYIALPNWLIKLLRVYIVPDDLFNYFKNLIVDLAIERKKSGKTGRDFLQLLLDSKLALIDPNQLPEGTKISKKDLERELTDNEMASSSVLFIIGGYDTSSLQLSWMCYRLALNPEVQERLYQEIMENDTDDYDVLLTMPYLNAVFMETLRMDTPVYCTMRMANKPWQLSDKVEIPKGATVEVPIQVIHMDPDYFPEPEVFDPDRFMPERRAEIPSNAFYGFGSGPRICIGMRFALLDVKIAIVELLKRYELLSTMKNPECGKFSHVRRPIRMDIKLKRRTD